MPLLKAEFDCEVLTPMFLSGVDQKSCELRAPSLRGALRYWYRALLGGQGVTELSELKKKEAAIFGSTEIGSLVSIRILPVGDLECKAPDNLPSWDTKRSQIRQNTGIGYLWFSVTLGDNERHYIQPGTKFKVVFSTIATGTQDQRAQRHAALQNILRAFWLLEHLGGIGTRARRGAGSFWITGFSKQGDVEIPRLAKAFSDSIVEESLSGQDGSNGWINSSKETRFPALVRGRARIVRQTLDVSSWEDAIETVGRQFKEARLEYKDDSDSDRTSFGLPLKLGRRATERTISLDHPTGALESDRRSSPLHIRIVPIRGGTFDAIYTHMGGPFATPEHKLEIKRSQGGTSKAALPDPGLIPEFLDSLADKRTLFS